MMMTKFRQLCPTIAVLLLILLAGEARPQIVNVLDPSTEGPERKFGLVLEESLVLRSGNSSTLDLRSRVSSHFVGASYLLRAILFSELSRADGASTANHHFVHVRWKWNRTPGLAFLAFLQMEHNDRQDIKSRSLFGAGVEYSFRPNADTRIAVSAAAMPEYEVLKGFDFDDGDYRTRLSCYLSGFLKLSKNSSLISTTFYQPNVSDWGFFRILQENSLNIRLSSNAALMTTLDVALNSRPPEGIERTDIKLLQGVSISF
jgi:hypothetical protein